MQFEEFLKSSSKIEKIALTKTDAHRPMAPDFRKQFAEDYRKATTRNAAVMPIIYPKNNTPHIVFIKRPIYKGAHSGQIAFAGGKEEKEDVTFLDTAFREVTEEIGIKREQLKFIKTLHSLYIPPSDFRVYAFLAYATQSLEFTLQQEEVAGVLEVPVSQLLNNDNKITMALNKSTDTSVEVPAYKFNNYKIWGATAMILHEVELLIRYSLKV